jgi:predicted nucleic acid-binding Zn ribbon protein
MPNYDFECQDCHETFEVRATIKEMEEDKISCVKFLQLLLIRFLLYLWIKK